MKGKWEKQYRRAVTVIEDFPWVSSEQQNYAPICIRVYGHILYISSSDNPKEC